MAQNSEYDRFRPAANAGEPYSPYYETALPLQVEEEGPPI
jgi:hypothetical protein